MSATEDDTELRDLLIQNLENNGVLNKLKAEMRAAVFLAMDEQDKVENKTPLVNENLKKCLNTKDGRLVASLIIDFLQVFHLDFTLAVFQPEINSLNGLDSRDQVCRELGITETEINRNTPLLLELTRRNRHKDKASIFTEGDKITNIPKELSLRKIADARKKFDIYDKDRTGGVKKEDLKSIITDLFPNFNKGMLERYITDELRTADKGLNKAIDFHEFLGLYKRLFIQCRSVVSYDCGDAIHPPTRFDEKICTSLTSKIPRFKGHKHSGQERNAPKGGEAGRSDPSLNSGSLGKGDIQLASRHSEAPGDKGHSSVSLKKALDLEVEEDADEGDSFFDDPLPRPQKTYGCLSALGSDTEGEELLSDNDHKQSSEHRRAESARPRGSPVGSLTDAAAPLKSRGSNSSGDLSHREHSGGRNGTPHSKDKGVKDLKAMNDKTGSLVLVPTDDDVEYDDDFNSHRSDISKSEVSIGEEIEEVSIEGPENSDKLDESTQDLSISQLSPSQDADYMEDVA